MSKREPDLLITDIIDSAQKILEYSSGMSFDDFLRDSKTLDAVIRNFEIIGEASNRLPDQFKDQHTSIDWARLRGFRNRIVHHYFGIDYSIVWQIKESYLPDLLKKLTSLI
jgi:uncharacterized protein with HEPN domain